MRKVFLYLLVLPLISFMACESDGDDNDAAGTTPFEVHLTDSPAVYNEVNVEIIAVEVHSDQGGWTGLNVNQGVYNLLDLTGGNDTLIASANLPSGNVSQIRLILGDNNTIVDTNGITHDLKTPSGQQSGLKLQIHAELIPDVTYAVLLDFDAARSVVETGNGMFILKPVIRAVAEGLDGIIEGEVDPATATSVVYAIQGTDSVSTSTTSTGAFSIQGLATGTYDVWIHPVAPWNDTTISNVQVTAGSITDIGTIQLTQ